MDYRLMINYHRNKGADLTVAAIEFPKEQAAKDFGIIEIDKNYRMTGFEEKPTLRGIEPRTIPGSDNVLSSMGVYLFNTNTLIHSLNEIGDDFGRDIIPKMIGKHKISVYNYTTENEIRDYIYEIRDGIREKVLVDRTKDSSYWRDIGTIKSYYDAHMDLIGVDPALNLYGEEWAFRTSRKQYPGAKFIFNETRTIDSVISDGCIISGGIVVKSVLSPGVVVEKDALVEESILLDGVEVGSNARIRKAIIDKGVKISPGASIGYDLEEDIKRFTVDSGIVVVPKGLRV
jgi:glucose-1-phosphate adenylyltransferase